MSEISYIKILLHKFILNQCDPEEIQEVVDYYRASQLTSDFPTVEDIKMLLGKTPQLDGDTADHIFANILSQAKDLEAQPVRVKKFAFRRYAAIAATLLLLLTFELSYRQAAPGPLKAPALNQNQITLQLGNGDIQVLSEDGKSTITDADGRVVGNQTGNKIVYEGETGAEKLTYNIIKIPNGKRFQLQLADGSVVHLNSGTTFKYPVKFLSKENRQVFLDGEAFFDVAKDKEHPFIVNADDLNVRVLGTHFNVSDYPEDDLTDVVLVEGSVGMYTQTETFDATKSTILKPGFKGSFDRKNARIDTKAVITDTYTSWIDGGLSFRNMSFKNIARKLERHYNITIVNQNNKLANETFSASFKDIPLEKMLGYFNEIHGFTYTINNNKIVISKN
jgi:hypothetical protein